MPVLKADPPVKLPEPRPAPQPVIIRRDIEALTPELRARIDQLRKAASAIAEESQRLVTALHNLRIHPPAAVRYTIWDLEENSRRLSFILNPDFLNADNQAGRVDNQQAIPSNDPSENRREKEAQ